MTTADWIKRRRELLDDATEAPWTPEDVYGLVAPTKIDGYTHPVERAEAIRQGAADDALIADARTSLPAALDALEAVLTYHRPGEGSSQGYTPDGYGYVEPYCAGCEASDEYAVAWPCPTVTAIEAALRAGS